jgi:biopolymer transport protein ExbB
MDTLLAQLQALWDESASIWTDGGWAMWAIAAASMVLFGTGMSVLLGLRGKGFRSVPESTWRRWIDHPRDREGPIGDLIGSVMARGVPSDQAIVAAFTKLRIDETAPFERDLRVMRTAVSAAPLFGLLGTVTGMLTTFTALATGSGGDQTMAMIAEGISEALITTETGLVVALPGVFFQYQLARRLDQYRAFLAHLETVCTQTVHRRRQLQGRQLVREAAQRRIAVALYERLVGARRAR